MEPPPFLCEELLQEILSLLPVKSLVRFKCVSKSWKSTVSDSEFIKLHLHRSSSTRNTDFAHIRSLLTSPRKSRSGIAAFPSPPPEYSFRGTCNGLICLSTNVVHDPERNECISGFRFWNPATRLMSQHSPPLRFTSTSGWFYGFGYDSSTHTYKVVVVVLLVAMDRSWSWETTMVNVYVYNMGDTCWRTIQFSHFPYMYPTGDAVYVSNTLNWLANVDVIINGNENDDAEQMNTNDPYTILSFDLGKESCAQLPLPCCTRYFDRSLPILGVLRGCLCISQTYKKTRFEIWQMKEFGVHESWTQLFNITGYESIILQNIYYWHSFVMYMSENGDALVLSRSSRNPLHAVLCTQKENKLEVTDIANSIVDCYATNYIESLVPPC